MGQQGPIACTARSPDPSPFDYYPQGHMKVGFVMTQTRKEIIKKIMEVASELKKKWSRNLDAYHIFHRLRVLALY